MAQNSPTVSTVISELVTVQSASSVAEASGWAFALAARVADQAARPRTLALAGVAFLAAAALVAAE